MGLEGMIEDVIRRCDFPLNGNTSLPDPWRNKGYQENCEEITNAENQTNGQPGTSNSQVPGKPQTSHSNLKPSLSSWHHRNGGAGKSSVTDEIVRRF
jgi:methylmalonyl-CoA mutase